MRRDTWEILGINRKEGRAVGPGSGWSKTVNTVNIVRTYKYVYFIRTWNKNMLLN
jgi:hypothetical protein